MRALALALLLAAPALSAQPAKPLSIDDVLTRLEANLNHYDTRVPSLFCDEHVVSSQSQPDQRNQVIITDSIFRLKRTPASDHTTTLVESREVKTVDGKPATSQHIDGPTLISGFFEGSLAVVSSTQSACMDYTLERPARPDRKHPTQPYIIRFATVFTPSNTAACLLQEKTTGRVLIDPASMQITRLELDTPHHTIIPGSGWNSPVIGKRSLTVDYTPILLNGETFWMPSAITHRTIAGDKTFHKIVWSYTATYTNYHKLEVTSRILPTTEHPMP